jgi:hypothetical protein
VLYNGMLVPGVGWSVCVRARRGGGRSGDVKAIGLFWGGGQQGACAMSGGRQKWRPSH